MRQPVKLSCDGRRSAPWQGELGDVRRIEREALLPHLSLTVLGKAHLLQPEAGHRRVEQPEQPQVLVLAGAGGQLDHRRRLLEDLATAVEDEMVMGGDLGEGNGQRCPQLVDVELLVFVPRQPAFDHGCAEALSTRDDAVCRPEVPRRSRQISQRQQVESVVVQPHSGHRAGSPVAHLVAGDHRPNVLETKPVCVCPVRQQIEVILSAHCSDADFFGNSLERLPIGFDELLQVGGTSPADAPWMPSKRRPRRVRHTDEIALRSRLVNLGNDGRPHEPARRVVWRARLDLDAHHRPHHVADRISVPAEQDHRRRAVPRDVGAGSVDYMRQV